MSESSSRHDHDDKYFQVAYMHEIGGKAGAARGTSTPTSDHTGRNCNYSSSSRQYTPVLSSLYNGVRLLLCTEDSNDPSTPDEDKDCLPG